MGQIKNIKLHIVTDIKNLETQRWVRTNTSKNSTRRSRVICFVSCSVFDVGNSAILLPSIVLHDPLVQTKQEDWGTEQNKGTSSTEFDYDVEDVRSQSPREQPTVSQNVRVSTKSSFNVELDRKQKRELGDWLVLSEC